MKTKAWRVSERKYGHIHGCQKSLAIQMPKLRKRAIHILSLLKSVGGGVYLAALKKGGIRAHIRTMSYIGGYLCPPPHENVLSGDQKLCKRSPYNASLKLSKTYVKVLIFQHDILNAKKCLDRCGISLWSSEKLKLFWFWSVLNVIFRILKNQYLT